MRLIDADALIEDLHGSLFYSDAKETARTTGEQRKNIMEKEEE